MGKNPAFQFYPKDWKSDLELQSCSIGARGVWIELMCIMHQSEAYGHLLVGGKPPPDSMVSQMIGVRLDLYRRYKRELLEKGVAKINGDGVIYCKRMVEDQRLREIRRQAGLKGGNPYLLNQKVKREVKQDGYHACTPPPSPSPSPSPSPKITERKPLSLKGFLEDHPDIHSVVKRLRAQNIWDAGSTLGELLREAPSTSPHVILAALEQVASAKPKEGYPYFKKVLAEEVERDLKSQREQDWGERKEEEKRQAPEALRSILSRLEAEG